MIFTKCYSRGFFGWWVFSWKLYNYKFSYAYEYKLLGYLNNVLLYKQYNIPIYWL